jgi:chorismate dehydratase
VSAIDFLNTAPLIWGLEREPRLQLSYTTPAACAEALRHCDADIGIIPVIEMARIPDLVALPGIAIAAREEVRSILLIARCAPGEIHTLALDESSRTSAALVQVILRGRYGCMPQVREASPDWRAMLETADGALLIGDPALKVSAHGEARQAGYRVLDVAREWFDWTRLPFVFAVWAVRREVVTDRAAAEWLVARFQQAKAEGLEHIGQIIARWSERLQVPEHEVRSYLRDDVQYELTEEHLQGLARFFELSAEAGLIESPRLPEFLPAPVEAYRVVS